MGAKIVYLFKSWSFPFKWNLSHADFEAFRSNGILPTPILELPVQTEFFPHRFWSFPFRRKIFPHRFWSLPFRRNSSHADFWAFRSNGKLSHADFGTSPLEGKLPYGDVGHREMSLAPLVIPIIYNMEREMGKNIGR